MSDKFFIQQPIRPIGQSADKNKPVIKEQPTTNFKEVFQQQLYQGEELKFSKHAQQRLNSRNIELGQDALAKLNNAVEKAADKGARESLVLMNDLAFVVSVKNKTVITAMDGQSIKENVFTNIDSAVII
ncbi:MAG: TIGR02530 family flagellar biosynthesis protein [Peptococcaceae bacterium]